MVFFRWEFFFSLKKRDKKVLGTIDQVHRFCTTWWNYSLWFKKVKAIWNLHIQINTNKSTSTTKLLLNVMKGYGGRTSLFGLLLRWMLLPPCHVNNLQNHEKTMMEMFHLSLVLGSYKQTSYFCKDIILKELHYTHLESGWYCTIFCTEHRIIDSCSCQGCFSFEDLI